MKQMLRWTLALLLGCSASASEAPKLVRIVKVLHETEPQRQRSALERSVSPNEVGKFKELREDFAPKPPGEYFTILWTNRAREPMGKVTVTLWYRQARLAKATSESVQVEDPARGTKRSQFQLTGDAFREGGPITAWKVEVAAEGKRLDSFHSFLWKDPS